MKKINVGVREDEYVTIPSGQYQRLNITTKVPKYVQAPLKKGDPIGELVIQFDNKVIENQPLYALQDAPQGGVFTRMKDSVRLMFKRWFNS